MAMSLDTYRIKDGVGIVSLCDVREEWLCKKKISHLRLLIVKLLTWTETRSTQITNSFQQRDLDGQLSGDCCGKWHYNERILLLSLNDELNYRNLTNISQGCLWYATVPQSGAVPNWMAGGIKVAYWQLLIFDNWYKVGRRPFVRVSKIRITDRRGRLR